MSASPPTFSLLTREFRSGLSCGRLGVREPESLAEWESLPLGKNVLPWLRGDELERLQRMLEFFLLNNQIRKATSGVPWLQERRAQGDGGAASMASAKELLFVPV